MDVPGPEQLLREWQQALGRLATIPFGDVNVTEWLRAPMEAQAKLLQQALDQQLAFQRALAERMSEPLNRSRELLDHVGDSMRTQARALRQAGTSLDEVAGLLEAQASLLERAGEAMAQGTDLLRTLVAPIPPRGETAPPA
jgi:hypothetical protein